MRRIPGPVSERSEALEAERPYGVPLRAPVYRAPAS